MKRYAHVWSPVGLVELPVAKNFPDAISFGEDVYLPDVGPDGALLLTREGRDTILDYRQRHAPSEAEAAAIAEAPTVTGRLKRTVLHCARLLGYLWCGLWGHDYHREGRRHVALVCWSCGKATPGWDLD